MPQVTAAELAAFLRSRGFVEQRQAGSHRRLRHPDGRAVTIPIHGGRDLGRGLAVKILKDADFSPDDFIRLR